MARSAPRKPQRFGKENLRSPSLIPSSPTSDSVLLLSDSFRPDPLLKTPLHGRNADSSLSDSWRRRPSPHFRSGPGLGCGVGCAKKVGHKVGVSCTSRKCDLGHSPWKTQHWQDWCTASFPRTIPISDPHGLLCAAFIVFILLLYFGEVLKFHGFEGPPTSAWPTCSARSSERMIPWWSRLTDLGHHLAPRLKQERMHFDTEVFQPCVGPNWAPLSATVTCIKSILKRICTRTIQWVSNGLPYTTWGSPLDTHWIVQVCWHLWLRKELVVSFQHSTYILEEILGHLQRSAQTLTHRPARLNLKCFGVLSDRHRLELLDLCHACHV